MSEQNLDFSSDQAAGAPCSQPRLPLPLARSRLVFNAALASVAAFGFIPAASSWETRFGWSLLGLCVSLLCVAIGLMQLWPLLFPPNLAEFAPEGLTAPALFKGVIPWTLIRRCEKPGGKMGSSLRIYVEEDAYDGVTRRAVWLLRSKTFDLELAFGNIDRQKAFEACSAFIAAARRDAPAGVFAYGRRRGDNTLETIQKGEAAALWFAVLLCLLVAGQMIYDHGLI